MTTEATARMGRVRRGWTLLESLLVVAIMATIFAVVVPLLHCETAAFDAAEPTILKVQEARFALAHVASAIRQARAVTSVMDTGMGTAWLSFLAGDGTPINCTWSSVTKQVVFGRPDAPKVLARNCSSFTVKCYRADGSAMGPIVADPVGVKSVEVGMTVTDPKGRGDPTSLKTRVTLARTRSRIIINEIMYRPPGSIGADDKNRWVELYNPSTEPISVAGWFIWTKDQVTPDVLLTDARHGTGAAVIPAYGYAIITDQDSQFYGECLKNGDFEEDGLHDWQVIGSNCWRSDNQVVSGRYAARLTDSYSWMWVYQDFKTPATPPRLTIWEKTTATTAATMLSIQVTNRSNQLMQMIYQGRASAEWTKRTATVSLPPNWDVRLMIKAYVSSTSGSIYIDGASIGRVFEPPDCVCLMVSDNEIGDDLSRDQVFLSNGAQLQDVAVFKKSWGGDDDGSTLSRTGPFVPPTEEEAWTPGPYGGTPGEAN